MNSNNNIPNIPIRGSSVLRGHPGMPQVGTAPTPSRAVSGTPPVDMTRDQLTTYLCDVHVYEIESSKKDSEFREAQLRVMEAQLQVLDAQSLKREMRNDELVSEILNQRDLLDQQSQIAQGIPQVYSSNVHSPVIGDDRKMPAKTTCTQPVRSPETDDDDDNDDDDDEIFDDPLQCSSEEECKTSTDATSANATSAKKTSTENAPTAATSTKKTSTSNTRVTRQSIRKKG